MTEEKRTIDLMLMGFNLGIMVISSILSEEDLNAYTLNQLSVFAAEEVEKLTGKPAEDLMLAYRPIIDKMVKDLREAKA